MSSTKTTSKKQKKPDEAGFSCYIGPSIMGVIQQNTIMPGSVEDMKACYAQAIEKYPLIDKMMVDGCELAEARSKAKTPGNLLHVYYRRLAGK